MLPAQTNISATAVLPALLAESSDGPNQCNVDVPTTNALDRYTYTVNFLTSNGLYAVSLTISCHTNEQSLVEELLYVGAVGDRTHA